MIGACVLLLLYVGPLALAICYFVTGYPHGRETVAERDVRVLLTLLFGQPEGWTRKGEYGRLYRAPGVTVEIDGAYTAEDTRISINGERFHANRTVRLAARRFVTREENGHKGTRRLNTGEDQLTALAEGILKAGEGRRQ